MAELDDVRIGETIAVEWGNAIRDRTIQRYADAAERDELHPNPTEGDLSYLEDVNSIEVYDGFAWVAGIPNQAVTTAKIADGAVTTDKIADQAVTNDKLRGDAVTTVKIATDAVTTSKIADGHVTAAKLHGAAISAFERSGATVATSVSVPASIGNLATVTLNIPSSWSSWECVAFAQATAMPLDELAVLNLLVRIDGTDGANFTYQLQGPPPLNGAVVAASFRSGITATGTRTIALRGVRGSTGVTLGTVFLYARAFRTS